MRAGPGPGPGPGPGGAGGRGPGARTAPGFAAPSRLGATAGRQDASRMRSLLAPDQVGRDARARTEEAASRTSSVTRPRGMDVSGVSVSVSGAAIPRSPASDLAVEAPSGEWSRTSTTLQDILGSADNENHGAAASEDMYSYGSERMISGISDDQDDVADVVDDFGANGEPPSEIVELENRLALLPVLVKQNSDLRGLWDAERERAGTLSEAIGHLQSEVRAVSAARDEARLWEGLYRFRLELHQRRACGEVMALIRADLPALLQVPSCELIMADDADSTRPTRLTEAIAFVLEHRETLESDGMRFVPIFADAHGVCAVLRIEGTSSRQPEAIAQSACEEIGVVLAYCLVDRLKDETLASVNKALADAEHRLGSSDDDIDRRAEALRIGGEVIAEAIEQTTLHDSEIHFIELLERGIRTCVQADLCALQFMDKRIEVQKALAVSTSLQVTLGDRRAELILGRRQRIHGPFEPWEQAVALKLAENVWGLYELSKKLAQKTAEIQDRKTDLQQRLEAAEARIGQMQSAHSRAARIEALYTLVSRLLASDSEESLVKIVQDHVPNVLEVTSVRLVLRHESSSKDSSSSSTQAFHIHEDAHLFVDGKPNVEWADTVVDLVGCALDQARKRNQNAASIASLSAACARSRDDAQANESLRLRAEAESVRIAETARVILEKLASPKPPSLEQVCLMAQESVNTVVAPDEHAVGHRQWVRVLILDLDSMDESNLFELNTDQEDTISARASTREPIARVVVPSNLQNIKVRLGQGLVGRVLSSGRTHIVTGDRIAREEALVRDLDRPDTSALLCVPIVGSRAAEALSPAQSNDGDAQRVWASSSGLASGVLGCIQVARVAAGSSFGELDGKLVRMIAGHLARQIELARAQTRADDSFTQSATARSEIADFAAVLCALEVPRSSGVSLLHSHIIPLVEKLGCRLRVAEVGSSPSAGKQEHVRRFETRTLESRHQGKSDHVLLSCSKPTAVFHYLCDVMPLALRLADALEQIGADASSLRSRDSDLSQVQAERDELASNVERFRKLVAIAASVGGSNAPAKTSETSYAAVVSSEEDPVERLSWYVEELFGSQLHGIWYSRNAVPAIFKSACEEAVNAPHWAGVPAGEAHVLVVEEDRESEVPFSPGRRLLGRDDLEILILLASWLGRAHQRFAQISQLQVALRDASQGLSDTRAGAEGAASSLSITSEAMRMIIACTEVGFLERHTLDVETLRDELPAWISRGAPEGLSCTLLDNEKALEAAIRAGHVIIESPCEHETGLMVSVAGAEEAHVTAAFAVAHVHAFALTRALEAQRESADREDLSVQLHQSRHHVFLQDLALRMGAGANVADAIGTEGILRNQCADLCAELGASFVHAFELGPGGVLTCRTLPSSLQAAMPNVGESCSLVLHPPLPADFRKLVDANPVSPHPIDAGAPWVERCTLTLAHNVFERCRLVFVAGHILSEGETLNAEHVRDFLERAVCLIGNAFETRQALEDLRSEKARAEEGLQSAIEAHTRLEAAKEDLEKRFIQAKALDETLSALASASTVEEIATLILAHLESGHPGRCCLFIRQDITAFQEQECDATMVDWTEPARQTSDDGLVGVCSKSQSVIYIREDLVSDARYVYRIDGAGMASHPSSLVCVPILASLHAEENKSTLGVICVANPERSRIDSLSVLASASALALAGQTLHHAKEAAQEALRDIESAMVDVKRTAVTGEDLARLQRRSEDMIKEVDTAIARAVSVATSGGGGEYENKDDVERKSESQRPPIIVTLLGHVLCEMQELLSSCAEETIAMMMPSSIDKRKDVWCVNRKNRQWAFSQSTLERSVVIASLEEREVAAVAEDDPLHACVLRQSTHLAQSQELFACALRNADGSANGLLLFCNPQPATRDRLGWEFARALRPLLAHAHLREENELAADAVRKQKSEIALVQESLRAETTLAKNEASLHSAQAKFGKLLLEGVLKGKQALCEIVQHGFVELLHGPDLCAAHLFLPQTHMDQDDEAIGQSHPVSSSLGLFTFTDNMGKAKKACKVVEYVASMGQSVKSSTRMTLPVIEAENGRVLGVLDLHATEDDQAQGFDNVSSCFTRNLRAGLEWCALAIENVQCRASDTAALDRYEELLNVRDLEIARLEEHAQNQSNAQEERALQRDVYWEAVTSALGRIAASTGSVDSHEDLRHTCRATERELDIICGAEQGSCRVVLSSQNASAQGLLAGCVIPLHPYGEESEPAIGFLSVPLDAENRRAAEMLAPALAALLRAAGSLASAKAALADQASRIAVSEASAQRFESRLSELEETAGMQQAKETLLRHMVSCRSIYEIREAVRAHASAYFCPGTSSTCVAELHLQGAKNQMREGLGATALSTGQIVCARDVLEDARYNPDADARVICKQQARGLLAVPLRSQGSSLQAFSSSMSARRAASSIQPWERDPLGVLIIWTVDVLSAADMEQMQARCESLRRELVFVLYYLLAQDQLTRRKGMDGPWASLCRELCADKTRPGPLKRCLEELCADEAKCTFEGISVASPDRAGVFLYLLEDSAKALKGDAEVVCKSKSPYMASRSRRVAIPCSYRDSRGVVRVVGVLHVCRGGGFDATSSLAALQHIGELLGAFMRRVLRERASLAKSMAYEKRVSQLEHLASTRKSSASPGRPGTAQVGGRDAGSSGMLSRDLLEKCNKLEDQLMDAELSLERADRDRASLRTALQHAEKKVEQLRTAVKRADARQHEIETNAAVVLESARKMKADAEVKRRELERRQADMEEERARAQERSLQERQLALQEREAVEQERQLALQEREAVEQARLRESELHVERPRQRAQRVCASDKSSGTGRGNGADSDCELFDESKVMISENLSRSALSGGPAMTAVAAAMRSRPLPPPHPSGTLKELQRVCEQMRESQTKRAASIRELINLEQVQLDGEAKLSASRLPTPSQLGTPIQTVPWSTVKRVAQRSAQKAASQQRRERTRTRPQPQEEPK